MIVWIGMSKRLAAIPCDSSCNPVYTTSWHATRIPIGGEDHDIRTKISVSVRDDAIKPSSKKTDCRRVVGSIDSLYQIMDEMGWLLAPEFASIDQEEGSCD